LIEALKASAGEEVTRKILMELLDGTFDEEPELSYLLQQAYNNKE